MSDKPETPAEAGETTPEPKGEGGAKAQPKSDTKDLSKRLRLAEKRAKEAEQLAASLKAEAEQRKLDEMSEIDRYKTENETLKKAVDTLGSDLTNFKMRSEFKLAAKDAGAIDAEDIWKLADVSKLEVDGDNVTGVADVLSEIKTSKPHLFGVPPTTTGTSGANPGDGPPKRMTPERIEAMDHEQRTKYFGF